MLSNEDLFKRLVEYMEENRRIKKDVINQATSKFDVFAKRQEHLEQRQQF